MPKIQVGDVNLNYDVAGKGEPLLMIMGLGASSAEWDPELVDRTRAHVSRDHIRQSRHRPERQTRRAVFDRDVRR